MGYATNDSVKSAKKTQYIVENRKIIHIDMDAFYASVEQRDFPSYRARPVIVGGRPDRRGVVAACSYEARKYGIHSAMPSSRAHRLCPHAIFLSPRFDIYRKVSEDIRAVFKSYTDLVEPLSLDEAFLDVTDCNRFNGSATRIAQAIKKDILAGTQLTSSAGVSYNKFLAKIASDMDKPDGLYVITPEQGEAFVEKLPVGKFFGVGKATESKMKALGIEYGSDLKKKSREELNSLFGKMGDYYFNIARGIDNRPVKTNRARKSLGSETTFESDLDDINEIENRLTGIAVKVSELLTEKGLRGKTVTLKVKYDDFTQVTRSITLEQATSDMKIILDTIPVLLSRTEAGRRKVRLLGITISNFSTGTGKETIEQFELL